MSPASWAVLAPLLGVVLTLVVPRRLIVASGLVAAAGSAAAAGALTATVWRVHEFRESMGGWGAPLGIDLRADGLAAAMILVTSTVGFVVSVYAASYAADDRWTGRGGFWPAWMLTWAALHALFLSADLFNLYVALELLGLAAAVLVILRRELPALVAATRYLLIAFAGSMLYLLGVALLYAETGSLDLYVGGAPHTGGVALVLMTAGLLLKTGLFPLHFWLPAAHALAPGPVSPLLSALVVKATFYLVVRLWVQALPDSATAAGAWTLGLLGAGAIGWGALGALRQERLKLLVAYSTVAHLGYLFLLFPLARTAGASDAWSGALYHAVAHAPAKAALFLAAATALRSTGSDRIDDLRGAALRLPATAYAFGLASASLVGLPPTGGFVAKWHLVSASVAAGQGWWAVVIVAGGLLTAAYLLPVLQALFGPAGDRELAPVPRSLELATLVAALLSVGLGLRSAEILELVHLGA